MDRLDNAVFIYMDRLDNAVFTYMDRLMMRLGETKDDFFSNSSGIHI